MRTGVIHFLDDKRGTGAIDQRNGDVIVFRTAGLNSALSQFIGQVEGKVFFTENAAGHAGERRHAAE